MTNNIRLVRDVMHEVNDRAKERQSKGIEFSLSGISRDLNNLTYGLQRGKLTIIGGRPSNGKTAVMIDIAYNLVEQGKKVAFISLEMDCIDIVERLMSRKFCINNRKFLDGTAPDELYAKYGSELNKSYEQYANMVITQNIGFTFKQLEQTVKETLKTYDVIIVDYLQMIKGSATAKENMEEYLKNLRLLALETNKVIVLGSQINRAGTSGEVKEKLPTMAELKGSGAIEEVADAIILCHWQYFYTKTPDDKNKYLLIVAKNRVTGLTGYVPLTFTPEFYRFSEGKK